MRPTGREIGPSAWTDFRRKTLRASDQGALDLIAALLDKERHLDLYFDPFSKHRHTKTLSEPDDNANDGQRSLALANRGNECPIDLDPVEREGLDLG